MTANGRTRVAIACQGGGSHTAFTAGVLQGALANLPADVELAALSGTSGGAICAALAWEALVRGEPRRAIHSLQKFWESMGAAVEVLSGHFEMFSGEEICAECLLASAAIPELFQAVPVPGRGVYWDGFIEMLNRGIARGRITDPDLRSMRVSRISMDRELNYRSKLGRRPDHLDELREFGRTKWRWFLKERESRVEQSSHKGAA